MSALNVVIAVSVSDELRAKVRALHPRLRVTLLSRAQRHAYRRGQPIWLVYGDQPPPEDRSPTETRASLAAALGKAEVLLSSPLIHPDLPALAPRLRWLQLTSAGAEQPLISQLIQRGVTVTTASGIHAVPIGEFVIGLMLAFAKGLPRALRKQMERAWLPYLPDELQGKTVGILGAGAIGGQVARYAKVLGMRVIATRRSGQGRKARLGAVDELLPSSQLPRLLSESDYLVIAVPLTKETHHMIGEKELRAMKPSAILINVSRGAVVDEEALVRALKEGWIAGAGLDVFEQEPLPSHSELWGMDNVTITPHVAGSFPQYMERAVDLFCDNLRRYLAGEPLLNVVDLRRGY